ncbi:hypothetical protein DFH27DRAFT_338432 [Peziza echinospora]|nr:hypothetical protein DFH27DRAFT_338432 [Peziza echinospora]
MLWHVPSIHPPVPQSEAFSANVPLQTIISRRRQQQHSPRISHLPLPPSPTRQPTQPTSPCLLPSRQPTNPKKKKMPPNTDDEKHIQIRIQPTPAMPNPKPKPQPQAKGNGPQYIWHNGVYQPLTASFMIANTPPRPPPRTTTARSAVPLPPPAAHPPPVRGRRRSPGRDHNSPATPGPAENERREVEVGAAVKAAAEEEEEDEGELEEKEKSIKPEVWSLRRGVTTTTVPTNFTVRGPLRRRRMGTPAPEEKSGPLRGRRGTPAPEASSTPLRRRRRRGTPAPEERSEADEEQEGEAAVIRLIPQP